jgi:hypothetical protein
MNGQDINSAIMDRENGTVAAVIKAHGSKGAAGMQLAMRDLYLAALNRPPTSQEYGRILNPKVFQMPRVKTTDPAAFWTGFYQDLFWAVLNSNEFILNH